MVVGLTGKYCAGKSSAARLFEEHGFLRVDVDSLGHEALAARRDEVAAAFGAGILACDGSIDRRRLGGVVFRDPCALARLEAIVHPWMKERVRLLLAQAGGRQVVIDAALLVPMGLDSLCDVVVIVRAPLCMRLRRARERDRLGLLQILFRFWRQRGLRTQPCPGRADTVCVENSRDPAALRLQVEKIALWKKKSSF